MTPITFFQLLQTEVRKLNRNNPLYGGQEQTDPLYLLYIFTSVIYFSCHGPEMEDSDGREHNMRQNGDGQK